MTTDTFAQTTPATAPVLPRRGTLVLLAAVFLVAFAVLMATGSDNAADTPLTTIKDAYDQRQGVFEWTSYAAMAACAVLVFLGVGLRTALRSRPGAWTADVAMLGFVVISLTVASWVVSGASLWHAVDQGDDASVRTLNYIDTSSFLPLMIGMACAMIGTGTAGLAAGTLPRWLAVVSIVIGCLAPLGPLGFVPAMLLPLWALAVAVWVRLEPGRAGAA
jgi:hypothetical protein